ncbi:ceramidase [Lasiosphaeria ovina]|uniref:Ceramidase n=1 Tax=Lasiosphaeria ovina TaxID=92902 RepID=A0AAE0KDF4_9PEZI|nr:ceramidase [Lasiosphaeria ovina]
MGHHNRHFAGDPTALSGAYGPPTSTANFCEEDYVVTRYLAEFINALTNLAYVYFALRYMYGPGSRGLLSPRWDFMSASLLVLGGASFLFHATLRHYMQFADELSMLGVTWSVLQGTMPVRHSPTNARLISAGLALFNPLFSAFYVWTGEIIYHYTAFGAMIVLITLRGIYLFYYLEPAFPEAKRRSWRFRGWRALFAFVFGYVLWNIDLEFCAELRELREHVGLPWAWLLELHGWWHVLTAIGASQFMDIVREMHQELSSEKEE